MLEGLRALAGRVRASLCRGRPLGRHHRRRDGRAHGAPAAAEDGRRPRRRSDHLRGADSIGEESRERAAAAWDCSRRIAPSFSCPTARSSSRLYLALNYIGVIPVMALRAHRHAEIRHFVRSSGAAAYFIADRVGSFDYRPMAAEIAAEFPSLRHVVVVGRAGAGPDGVSLAVVERRGRRRCSSTRVRPDPSDVSTMLLSGGTTSLSKLIPRTHNDYVYNARVCAEVAGFSSRHRVPGHAAARAQLQPGLSWAARRVLRRRHARHRDGARTPTRCSRPLHANA